ncbi:hypothetical protein V1264_020510 [Littorina saxatilis]|uniref:Uncharacterized protein n=2 Tax=Littorina saxatilis TaxID=31220 RepID=A0AAN9BA81_9CAEN
MHRTTMNQIKHTVNTLYVVIDVLLLATPFRLFHMFATIFLGSLYVLFNSVLFLNGQTLTPDFPHPGGRVVEESRVQPLGRWRYDGGRGVQGRWGEPASGVREEEAQVYNYLDWHKPVEAIITCVMAMFLCVLAQTLLFLVFRLRLWAWQRLHGGEGWRVGEELQNIVMSQSSSYNTIDENAEEQSSIGKKPVH